MEEQRNHYDLLDQIPQPGFLVRENRILQANQAAQAMFLTAGQCFSDLICTGAEEYASFRTGQLCLTLTIGGRSRNALIIPMEDADLVLPDPDSDLEEFRSMALVAMELRRPLMQAFSCAQKQPADPGLNRSLMQMLRMVSNMADISQYHSASRMETRDVDAFLLELFEKARTLAQGKADITFQGLKQPVFSLIDPDQLERAVWNILSNCLKFLPEGGTVSARLTRRDRQLRLTIEDSGSGIAEDIRATLFRRYLRQPGVEDNRYGIGLGLAIVRTVAANHGGTVLVSPDGNGGTRITMTLTLRQDDSNTLRSPLLRPDYAGGWDHGLVELSDCLPVQQYAHL